MSFPNWTWPDWRKAKPGTRFRDTRTGFTGTLVGPSKNRRNGARVKWDVRPGFSFADQGKTVDYVGIAAYAEPLPLGKDHQ